MKLLLIALLSTISLCFAASAQNHASFADQISRKKVRPRSKLRQRGACVDSNINVCFAIEGTLSISKEDFEWQRLFIFDITSILIDFPVSYAAAQYAKRIKKVSPLTNAIPSFIYAVNETRHVQGRATNIARGIKYCTKQLRRHPENINSIFLFTDGRANRGRDPIRRARRFRSRGGKLFVVGVASGDNAVLLAIAGGDPSKVLDISDFLDTLSATHSLEDAFVDTCGQATPAENEESFPSESSNEKYRDTGF